MITSRVSFDYKPIRFDFKLKNRIVVVDGDTGTGKSMFCALLGIEKKTMAKSPFSFEITIFNEDLPLELDMLKALSERLIVIDNADMLLTDSVVAYIAQDDVHQYLIFARVPWDFRIKPDNFAEIEFDEEVKTYYLKYFEVPGW